MAWKIFREELTLESYYYKVIISLSCPSFQNYTIHIITSQVDNGNLFKIGQKNPQNLHFVRTRCIHCSVPILIDSLGNQFNHPTFSYNPFIVELLLFFVIFYYFCCVVQNVKIISEFAFIFDLIEVNWGHFIGFLEFILQQVFAKSTVKTKSISRNYLEIQGK